MNDETKLLVTRVVVGVVLCAAFLGLGVKGMKFLAKMKKNPETAANEDRALHVEAIKVQPVNEEVMLTGFGEVRSLDVVRISSEVAGKIVNINPKLEVGETVLCGDLLFEVDPQVYKARLDEAEATHGQLQAGIKRQETQISNDSERLKNLRRSRDLAMAEYERVKQLFVTDEVGTQSGVDAAERAYNAAKDLVDQLEKAVAVYTIQISESQKALEAASARSALAKIYLDKSSVAAEFDARIKTVNLEQGQYVSPGAVLLTLANDSVLEMSVPLDSREAREWLQFDGVGNGKAWFSNLKPVDCEIRWTENSGSKAKAGKLHRVERFDETTRTLYVAVRIDAKDAKANGPDDFPLVDGMFCSVEIPGKTMTSVYRLPRWAVSMEEKVYIANDSLLKKVPVQVARSQGEDTFVSGGLQPGDSVIVTRLINPLEGILLNVNYTDFSELGP